MQPYILSTTSAIASLGRVLSAGLPPPAAQCCPVGSLAIGLSVARVPEQSLGSCGQDAIIFLIFLEFIIWGGRLSGSSCCMSSRDLCALGFLWLYLGTTAGLFRYLRVCLLGGSVERCPRAVFSCDHLWGYCNHERTLRRYLMW